MRRKPLSPSFFSHSNYSRLLLILLLLLIAVTLVSAAVFVYYPVGLTASWVAPPIRFLDPLSGVSVTLSNENTTAVVDVPTTMITRDLILVKRNAFIYDDFNNDPLANGRITILGSCNPGYRWVNAPDPYVVFDASNGASGGWNVDHMVAYYANQTSGTNVYLLMKTRRSFPGGSQANSWKGFFLFQSIANRLYYTYEFRDSFSPGSAFMTIVMCGPDSTTRLVTGGRPDSGGWYTQWGVRNRNTGYMQFTTYDTAYTPSTISVTNNSYVGAPIQVGFGGGLARGGVYYFDDFIASSDADPIYGMYADPRNITVIGLNPGWRVRVEAPGSTTQWAVADAYGVARINMMDNPIVRDGSLHVVGSSIDVTKQFSTIVGGDVYRFISVLTDRNLLAYHNYDTKSYNVYLKLDSYSISGTVYFLNLWVGSGTGTTPIRIADNVVVTDTSSTISLGASATNYMHANAALTPSSTVVLTLSFHYYIPSSEVEVEYPVTVTIHG